MCIILIRRYYMKPRDMYFSIYNDILSFEFNFVMFSLYEQINY